MKSQSGFTLIELMAALTLLALLLSASLPLADLARRRAQESELRHSLRQIRDAIDAYRQAVTDKKITVSPEQSGYPPSLASLVEGWWIAAIPMAASFTSCAGYRRADVRALRGAKPAESWDTRSYDSSVEAFSAGRDVYDIRSKSGGKGINGIPYQQW